MDTKIEIDPVTGLKVEWKYSPNVEYFICYTDGGLIAFSSTLAKAKRYILQHGLRGQVEIVPVESDWICMGVVE